MVGMVAVVCQLATQYESKGESEFDVSKGEIEARLRCS